MTKVRARAPLRLGLAGGGSDVSPYCDQFGGSVMNATIDMHANCTIETLEEPRVEFIAADLGHATSYHLDQMPSNDGQLDLLKAIYRRVIKDYNNGVPIALRVTTQSDAPPGSGLGSSSTVVVCVLKAFAELLKLPLRDYDIAHLAYEIERVDMGLNGGKQDQYAATFGGFNFMEFTANASIKIYKPLFNE